MDKIKSWFHRQVANPQIVVLAILLVAGFAIVIGMGRMLGPLLAALIFAYLLEAVVSRLQQMRVPRLPAVLVVFALFLTLLLVLVFGVIPLLSHQVSQFVQQIPAFLSTGQANLLLLPEKYPQFINEQQIASVIESLGRELAAVGQKIVATSIASVGSVIAVLVYLVLVPILVFFLLKDKRRIVEWFVGFLPRERDLATSVWREVDGQIGNYVRGKVVEIVIVGAASYVTFALMGLQYAVLLSTLVGFSVLIPYVGAAVVTLPVVLVAFFQWGWSGEFAYLFIAYLIIQALDGNVLVPLLFSEVVNLHPVAIIAAILVFGGFWGFWGVFFAIPLATLVQAIISAWPRGIVEAET